MVHSERRTSYGNDLSEVLSPKRRLLELTKLEVRDDIPSSIRTRTGSTQGGLLYLGTYLFLPRGTIFKSNVFADQYPCGLFAEVKEQLAAGAC